MIKTHAVILIVCSIIGFIGHYFQFGVARLTPWIPGAIAVLLMLLWRLCKNRDDVLKYAPLILVLVFGLLTTRMCIKFLPQEFQPLRKKIIFVLMSVSAWITIFKRHGKNAEDKEWNKVAHRST